MIFLKMYLKGLNQTKILKKSGILIWPYDVDMSID